MRKIAVFGTTHLLAQEPAFEGQRPVFDEWIRRQHLVVYSTGKLEQAIAEGYEVFVCSIRPAFGPHDEWWQKLVPEDHVFNAKGILAAFMHASDPMEAAFEPWKRLFAVLGVEWDRSFSDFDDPVIALVTRHGIRDGSTFAGHRLLQ